MNYAELRLKAKIKENQAIARRQALRTQLIDSMSWRQFEAFHFKGIVPKRLAKLHAEYLKAIDAQVQAANEYQALIRQYDMVEPDQCPAAEMHSFGLDYD